MVSWSFEHSWVLPLSGVVLLLVLYLRYRNSEAMAGGLFQSASTTKKNWHKLPLMFAFLAFIFAALALANPRKGTTLHNDDNMGIAIMNVLDVSGSMEALDFSPENSKKLTRMSGAKEVLKTFVRGRVLDLQGLIVFGQKVLTLVPMSSDRNLIVGMIEQVYSNMAGTGTAVGDAVALAVKRLRSAPTKEKVMIFLSDGASNSGTITPQEAAQFAKTENIRIYSIGIGRTGPVEFEVDGLFGKRIQTVQVDMDEAVLKMLASQTGGQYFHAENMDQLNEVYRQIDQLEKSEYQAIQSTVYDDYYLPFLKLAVICLLLNLSWQTLIRKYFPVA